MKTAKFTLRRNQMLDIIQNIKKLVRIYDDPKTPGRYIECPLLLKGDLCVYIVLDRSMEDKKCNSTNSK